MEAALGDRWSGSPPSPHPGAPAQPPTQPDSGSPAPALLLAPHSPDRVGGHGLGMSPSESPQVALALATPAASGRHSSPAGFSCPSARGHQPGRALLEEQTAGMRSRLSPRPSSGLGPTDSHPSLPGSTPPRPCTRASDLNRSQGPSGLPQNRFQAGCSGPACSCRLLSLPSSAGAEALRGPGPWSAPSPRSPGLWGSSGPHEWRLAGTQQNRPGGLEMAGRGHPHRTLTEGHCP